MLPASGSPLRAIAIGMNLTVAHANLCLHPESGLESCRHCDVEPCYRRSFAYPFLHEHTEAVIGFPDASMRRIFLYS